MGTGGWGGRGPRRAELQRLKEKLVGACSPQLGARGRPERQTGHPGGEANPSRAWGSQQALFAPLVHVGGCQDGPDPGPRAGVGRKWLRVSLTDCGSQGLEWDLTCA